jgi:catechol 2,3-dioxygenase-like lactoylglutathione lyase family enzyme
MRTYQQAKAMAKSLREAFATRDVDITHGECLEIVAHQFGVADWNTLSARIAAADGIVFAGATPIFRIFSVEKAREFYVDWLGFHWDWDDNSQGPVFAQVSRSGLTLHLSEHHGDGSPGASANITIHGVDAFQREISTKRYKYMNPGIEDLPWGRTTTIIDPFGNRLNFIEPLRSA